MANYKLDYTGEQVNTAIGNALNGGGGGGTQLYLHTICISYNDGQSTYSGELYLINDISTQITNINGLNNGIYPDYVGITKSILMQSLNGKPFESHTISFKNLFVSQALGFAEVEGGSQVTSCTDTVIPL